VQRFEPARAGLGRFAVTAVLCVTGVLLLGWFRPWTGPPVRAGEPTAVVRRDRFDPEWLRIAAGGCVRVDNLSGQAFTTAHGTVAATGVSRLCFPEVGTFRVKLGPRPYSGGFVYVEGSFLT
jgi:hypothetical protein